MQDHEKLNRELATIIRADVMTDLFGKQPTADEMKAAVKRSMATLLLPQNVSIEVTDDLQLITITHHGLP